MKLFDITLPISPLLPTWEGDPVPRLEPVATAGDYQLSRLTLGTHTGTHVDAPLHFGGVGGVDALELGALCGPATVVDLRDGPRRVDADALRRLPLEGVQRLLLATHRGEMHSSPMRRDHAYLTADAAAYLRSELGVLLLGTDCFSIDASDDTSGSGYPAHHALLLPNAAGNPAVIVLEGLQLCGVAPGRYELWCLPLLLAGGDGAPVRAVLVQR
jgi:arylformamidase